MFRIVHLLDRGEAVILGRAILLRQSGVGVWVRTGCSERSVYFHSKVFV